MACTLLPGVERMGMAARAIFGSMAFVDEDVLLELDGPGVHPDSVDTLVLLRLAEAYFRLLAKVSEAKKVGLSFTGLRVEDKCAAVVSRSSSAAGARMMADYSAQIVAGLVDAPWGAEMAANDVRSQVRALPAAYSAKVRTGKWVGQLQVADEQLRDYPWEATEVRAYVMKVGGESPRVHLKSDSEGEAFVLGVSPKDAEELGHMLYREVDLEVLIVRDPTGKIEDGRVTAIHKLQDGDSAQAWRSWFAIAGKDWNDVEDVLKELGRGD